MKKWVGPRIRFAIKASGEAVSKSEKPFPIGECNARHIKRSEVPAARLPFPVHDLIQP